MFICILGRKPTMEMDRMSKRTLLFINGRAVLIDETDNPVLELTNKTKELEPEFQQIINDNFWDLIGNNLDETMNK